MNTEQLKVLRTKLKEVEDKIDESYCGIYGNMNFYWSFDNFDDLFERVDYLRQLTNKQKILSEAISWIESEGK